MRKRIWFLCLCKLTIILVLNRSPLGSKYQLNLVNLLFLFPSLSHFPFCSIHSTQNCFIKHRLLMSLHRYVSLCCPPLHSFSLLPLLCPLIWLSSLCQSLPFLSSNLCLPLISFTLHFLLFLLSSTQSVVSLLPACLTLCLFLSELDSASLQFKCPTLIPALCPAPYPLCMLIYLNREGFVSG